MQATRPLTELASTFQCPSSNSQGPYRTRRVCIKIDDLKAITSGKKTVDARPYTGIFKRVRALDQIVFYNYDRQVKCEVLQTKRYNSIRQLLQNVGVTNCFPKATSIDEGITMYQQLQYQENVSLLAMHVRVTEPLKKKAVLTFSNT
jgi:ASC-1-like (ASCH) protein